MKSAWSLIEADFASFCLFSARLSNKWITTPPCHVCWQGGVLVGCSKTTAVWNDLLAFFCRGDDNNSPQQFILSVQDGRVYVFALYLRCHIYNKIGAVYTQTRKLLLGWWFRHWQDAINRVSFRWMEITTQQSLPLLFRGLCLWHSLPPLTSAWLLNDRICF